MSTTSVDRYPSVLWTMAPVFVLAPAITCVAPRIMIALYAICAFISVAAGVIETRKLPPIEKTLGFGVLGFVVYGCITQFWTIAPDQTLSKAFEMGAIFLLTAMLLPMITGFDARARRRLGAMLGAGLALGLTTYMFEAFNNFPLYDLVRGGQSHDVPDIKQNKVVFLLAVWAYLAFPYFIKNTDKLKKAVFAVLAIGVYAATFMGESASAQGILLVLPVLAAVLFILPVRASLITTLLVAVSLSVFMPVIAIATFNHTDWKTSPYLNRSLQSRIEIWDLTARRTSEKPVFGWGLDSAQYMPDRGERSSLYGPIDPPSIVHLHPHNGPLQIWFELGLIGIAGLCALFALFYKRIKNIAGLAGQRYAIFTWAIVFLYTLSIWGIWQSWFVASLCFAGVMTASGVRHLEDRA